MKRPILSTTRITIGPLRYEMCAHDSWGVEELEKLAAHCSYDGFTGEPDRILHLAEILDSECCGKQEFGPDHLPPSFLAMLPGKAPLTGWVLSSDNTGYTCLLHPNTKHALWVHGLGPAFFTGPFQLPWHTILMDIISRGGAIMHGGLIAQNNRGTILTAPPGGGKTTTIGRLSADWTVYSDDACLIWPDETGNFLASPLPTWSVILGRNEPLPAIGTWQLSKRICISKICLINKTLKYTTTLSPIQSTKSLLQALCEHVMVLEFFQAIKPNLFSTAYHIGKTILVYEINVDSMIN